jgi:hypothetical protein
MTLHPDATLTVRIGQRSYTTRPRLTDPTSGPGSTGSIGGSTGGPGRQPG